MSKVLSFRGVIAEGLEQRIKLATKNGKTGYTIKKFQTMSTAPGNTNYETVNKIYSRSQGSATTGVDFTEADLLAVSYIEDNHDPAYPMTTDIIFDNVVFNQDIYVTSAGYTGTTPTNYYIELETVTLNEVQSTQLTLKSLRTILQ
jgi:hypothetical protein